MTTFWQKRKWKHESGSGSGSKIDRFQNPGSGAREQCGKRIQYNPEITVLKAVFW